jgi:hypothetical protein
MLRHRLAGDVAAILDDLCDIPGDVIGPMLQRVEGHNANGIVELSCQKIIDDSLVSARQKAIDSWVESEKLTRQFSLDAGIEFIDLADDEYARWNEAVMPTFSLNKPQRIAAIALTLVFFAGGVLVLRL